MSTPMRSFDSRLDTRGFCGGRTPWSLIEELADGDEVTACYLLHESRRLETKHGKGYLKLLLGDRSGTIEAMVWDDADRWEAACVVQEVVGVRGKVELFRDKRQLRVFAVEPLRVDAADWELLLPASPRPREQMIRELEQLIASVADKPLRKLLQRCLGEQTELGRAFRSHPAAKRNHHAYLCGLLEHSLSVATLCDRMVRHYAGQGIELDRDLAVAGALLHDLGKVRELRGFPAPGYTTEGQLLGHIVIGIQLVGQEAQAIPELKPERLLLLQHLIASHQGKPEWDSPRVPQLREALVLHYADDLDAKLNQVGSLLNGVAAGEWSEYDRGLQRSFFVPPSLRPTREVEAVPPDEAAELLIDLFRG